MLKQEVAPVEPEPEPLRQSDFGDQEALESARRAAVAYVKGRMAHELATLIERLVSLESEVQNEVYTAIEQLQTFFNNTYKKRVEDCQPFLQAIRDCCERFHQTALDLLMKAVDKKMRKDAEAAVGTTAGDSGDLIMDQQQFTQQGQDSGAGAVAAVQEIQNLLPADITPEVLALLKDRDTAKSANMLAWDYKL